MREFSKFQVFTVFFLLMFVFVVGAIYTNTKEVAENKINETNSLRKQDFQNVINEKTNIYNQEKEVVSNLSMRVNDLESRIQKVSESNFNLKCKIQGINNYGNLIQMSEDEAIQQAKYNGAELVMTCNY